MGVTTAKYRVSFWDDGTVLALVSGDGRSTMWMLELARGDGCSTQRMYEKPLNGTL